MTREGRIYGSVSELWRGSEKFSEFRQVKEKFSEPMSSLKWGSDEFSGSENDLQRESKEFSTIVS
jgi:hypothetical protein